MPNDFNMALEYEEIYVLYWVVWKPTCYDNTHPAVKMQTMEIECKEALHELKRRGLPYKYDLNIYRGCSHGCKYCYARKSHEYLGTEDFDGEVFVKTNVAEVLDRELGNNNWSGDIINLGGVCDSYQHAEKNYGLMRGVLKVLIKHRNPVIISTKSDLILRDIDLIDELASHTYVNVVSSITSVKARISEKVEPGAALPDARYMVLKEFRKTRANTGLHLFPILPFLADDESTLETVVRCAREADVSYMMAATLYLTGSIKKRYLSFIEREFPEYYKPYLELYPKGAASRDYKTRIHGFLAEMRNKYSVNNSYSKFLPGK